ncbi:nucleotidyltransferase family protein [Escherichia coli]
MRPSVVLDMKRNAVREVVGRFRTANPRVFGSVLHGTDRDGSDIDLLVDALPGATLFDRHCCKVSDEAAFCLIQRPYISKTLLTRRISPRGSP